MIRQARTYMVGAMGGATLIAVAIAVFVVLVSAQVFKDWPIAALGGGGDEAASVSPAHPAGGSGGLTATGVAASSAGAAGSGRGGKTAAGQAHGSGSLAQHGGADTAVGPASTGAGSGGQGGSAGTGGGSESPRSSPTSGSPSPTTGGSGSGEGESGGGEGGGTPRPVSSPPAGVAETVNGTVAKVDETALGGTLGDSGVTEVTEGVVNGVVGPESTVGHVVDETVGALGGLLGGKR